MLQLHTYFVKWTTPISWCLVLRFLLHRHRRRKPRLGRIVQRRAACVRERWLDRLSCKRTHLHGSLSHAGATYSPRSPLACRMARRIDRCGSPVLYDLSRRCILTVPQQPPAWSATGKLVARCSWSFRRASSTGSLAPQQADRGRMIVSTRTSDARRLSAATPQHTSRSVTTPISLRCSVSSTTGAQPQPESRIACAASAAVSCGVQHEDASIGVITSRQQLMVLSSFSM